MNEGEDADCNFKTSPKEQKGQAVEGTSESFRERVWHWSPFVSPQPNPDTTVWTRCAPGRNPNLVALLLHAYL